MFPIYPPLGDTDLPLWEFPLSHALFIFQFDNTFDYGGFIFYTYIYNYIFYQLILKTDSLTSTETNKIVDIHSVYFLQNL